MRWTPFVPTPFGGHGARSRQGRSLRGAFGILDGSEHRDTHEVSTGYGYLQDKFNFS